MSISLALTRATLHLVDRVRSSDERGDVPAWVMITVMTAGIVGVLWGLAEDKLSDLLNNAFSSATTKH